MPPKRPLISADNHVFEPVTLWQERLPNEYREVREDPTLFVLRPGHDFPETETVRAKKPGYWIVRKGPGLPAAIAEATDPGI